MKPEEHAAAIRQSAELMLQAAAAVERVSDLESKLSDSRQSLEYANTHLGYLARFMGITGTTWAHVVSETISLIEKQKRGEDQARSELNAAWPMVNDARGALADAMGVVPLSLTDLVAEAVARIGVGKADAARLDWMDANRSNLGPILTRGGVPVREVIDAAIQPTEPVFKVGQVWADRGGREAEITQTEYPNEFPIRAGLDGWTGQGKYTSIPGVRHTYDLVTLVRDVPEVEVLTDADVTPEPTTVRGWLETLPDGYRERALTQSEALDYAAVDFHHAVSLAFSWHESNEGANFWRLVAEGQLPPLPSEPDELAPVSREWVEIVGVSAMDFLEAHYAVKTAKGPRLILADIMSDGTVRPVKRGELRTFTMP